MNAFRKRYRTTNNLKFGLEFRFIPVTLFLVMQFLKDLIHWFIHGTVAEPVENAAETSVEAPRVEKKAEKKTEKKPLLDVVDTILSEGHGEQFLQELKKIKPITKDYERDQAELIQEVKRLSSRKRP